MGQHEWTDVTRNMEHMRTTNVFKRSWCLSLIEQAIVDRMEIGLCFLLLMASLDSGHAQQALQCYNDMFVNITCKWDESENSLIAPQSNCTLIATEHSNGNTKVTCDLIKLDGKSRGCVLNFREMVDYFSSIPGTDKYDLSAYCESNTDRLAYLPAYEPYTNTVKMPPPARPTIENATIFWKVHNVSPILKAHEFTLQYRTDGQTWEDVQCTLIRQDTSVLLNEDELERGRQYWARVQVRPLNPSPPNVTWSDWSPVASWTSTVGRSRDPVVKDLETWLVWWAVIGALAVLAFLVVIMLMGARMIKLPLIPDPSKYFDGLDSVYKGNFKAWLGSILALDTLSTEQQSEDIAPVEVLKGQVASSFINNQYFCESQESIKPPPPSFEPLQPCLEFSPYDDMKVDTGPGKEKADMGNTKSNSLGVAGSSSSGGGINLEQTPILMCSSYEDLARLRQGAQSPDSGFSGGSMEEGSQEEMLGSREQEKSDEPDEKTPLAHPFGGTFSVSKAPRPLNLPLDKIEWFVPMTSHSLSSAQSCAVAPDFCSTPTGWLPQGHPLDVYGELEPSSDDYMPLQT